MTDHELSYQIRGAAMEVYNTLGPGLLESIYHKAMIYELQSRGLDVKSEVPLEVYYKGILIEKSLNIPDAPLDQPILSDIKKRPPQFFCDGTFSFYHT